MNLNDALTANRIKTPLTPFFVVSTFFILVFSYNYHALWLFYDLFAFYAIYRVFQNIKLKYLIFFTVWFLFLVCLMLYQAVMGKLTPFSILALWDNLKHIPIIIAIGMYLNSLNKREFGSSVNFEFLLKILTLLFYVEFLWVLIDWKSGYDMDDITGSFGFKATHALGYFTLLYLTFWVLLKKRIGVGFIVTSGVAVIINILAENVGFFALIGVVMAFLKPRLALLFLVLFVVAVVFRLDSGFFSDVVFSRMESFINFDSQSTRSYYMALSYELGGWFGSGIGSYSHIYGMDGSLVNTLSAKDAQLGISTVTTLLAEYGVLGAIIMVSPYIFIFWQFSKGMAVKLLVSVVLVLSFFYSRTLMDERIMFMLVLTLFLILFKLNYKFNIRRRMSNELKVVR